MSASTQRDIAMTHLYTHMACFTFQALCIFMVLVGTPLCLCQSTLTFREITIVNCPLSSTNLNYTLTVDAWPSSTPASSFVITIKSPGKSIVQYPVYATVDFDTYSVLADSQLTDTGELWVL